jgi:hypothetical protein
MHEGAWMKRRGQVSIFIIIGLIILISFLIFFYARRGLLLEREFRTGLAEVPVAFKPVERYIEYSIQAALISALQNAGQYGGYVGGLALDGQTEGLNPFRTSSRTVPYWYYMSSPDVCEAYCSFSTLMPPLKRTAGAMSIESQVDSWVKQRLLELDFSDFKFQGIDVEPLADPDVTATIDEGRISARVSYPLRLSRVGESVTLSDFQAQVPTEFSRVYSLAWLLTRLHRDTFFIEGYTLNLISTYSDLRADRLPPTGGRTEVFGSPVFWELSGVRTQLVRDVLSKLNLITFMGSSNFNPSDIVTGATVELGTQQYEDISIRLLHPDTSPFYLDINGLSQGLLGPGTFSTSTWLFSLVLKQYEFDYDLSFPVLVTLKAPYGLNNQDYMFQFALEANIRNNMPIRDNFDASTPGSRPTMFCNVEQRVGGETLIRAATGFGQPIPGVDLYYECAQDRCYVGKTGSDGSLSVRLPVCIGGKLIPVKDRHIGEEIEFDSGADNPGYAHVVMELAKPYTVEVRKLTFSPFFSNGAHKWPHELSGFGTFGYSPEVGELEADEQVFAIFTKLEQNSPIAYQFPVLVEGGGEEPQALLVPGEYEVKMMLFKHKPLVIPEHQCSPFAIGCIELNRTVLNTTQLGGGTYGDSTVRLTLPDGAYEKIILYVVYLDVFAVPEAQRLPKELSLLGKLPEYEPYLITHRPRVVS